MVDVFVIGGGPAGSVAARLLASWGWSVLVAHPCARSQPSLAESLPASTRKLLSFLDLAGAVEGACFHPNFGNIARWGDRSSVTTTEAPGFHVSRARLDEVLRQAAVGAGAHVVDAIVRRVEAGDPARIEYLSPGCRPTACTARYVLDCSGRAGVVARRGWRRTESAYKTIAIAAEWESSTWPANESAHTIVESYRDGWAWSVPLSATRRQFTVMIEPRRDRGGGGQRRAFSAGSATSARSALTVTYARELAKTVALKSRLEGARQTSPPWVCDASLYDCVRAADPGLLLVGDAASFIEPLSSAGVKKALASAWRAAVVTNTCLSRAEMVGAALEFFTRREHEVYADCRRRSARFFSEAAAAYGDRFWKVRADSQPPIGSSEGEIVIDDDLAGDDVRAAFEDLRRSPTVRLRATATLRVEPTPTIEGSEVVMRDALVLPGVAAPLRFAAGVNLPAVVGLAGDGCEMSALISAYQSKFGPVPLEGLLTGVSLLVARHALINEGFAS